MEEQQKRLVHCAQKAFSKASLFVSSVSVMDIQLGELILIFILKSFMLTLWTETSFYTFQLLTGIKHEAINTVYVGK